ncbi:MAG: hypothetical protein MRZ79_24175 [Bacteroidia bacterium]|nr:hypothetical protein [Bacteroidia bacterium]
MVNKGISKPSFRYFGTGLAILISISALMVSIYEANLLRTEQRALVWPYLSVRHSYNSQGFSFIATNNGTGPAIVKSVEVSLNDTLMEDYDQLLDLVRPQRKIGYDFIRMGALNNTVMKAGEEREIFHMPWTEETRLMAARLAKAQFKVNYCSVLEDCWIHEKKSNSHEKGKFSAKKEFAN